MTSAPRRSSSHALSKSLRSSWELHDKWRLSVWRHGQRIVSSSSFGSRRLATTLFISGYNGCHRPVAVGLSILSCLILHHWPDRPQRQKRLGPSGLIRPHPKPPNRLQAGWLNRPDTSTATSTTTQRLKRRPQTPMPFQPPSTGWVDRPSRLDLARLNRPRGQRGPPVAPGPPVMSGGCHRQQRCQRALAWLIRPLQSLQSSCSGPLQVKVLLHCGYCRKSFMEYQSPATFRFPRSG